jgi:hypothetical protein
VKEDCSRHARIADIAQDLGVYTQEVVGGFSVAR